MRAWHFVGLAVIAMLGLGGYHACNVYRVEALRDRGFHSLDDLTNVRGARALTAEMVRKRVVDRLGDMGISVRPEDVTLRIVPLTAESEKQLSVQARKAIAVARKMPNHEIVASVMTLDVTAKVQRGWVTRTFSIHRTYLVEGPALPTEREGENDDDF